MVENKNVGRKSKIWSKIKKVGRKTKFWSKIKILVQNYWPKIKIVLKIISVYFGKFLNIELLVKIFEKKPNCGQKRGFGQKSISCRK